MNNVRYKCLLPQGVVQFNTISLVLWGGGLTRVLSTLVKTMSVQHGNQLSAFKMLNQTTPQGNVAPMFMLIVIGWSITPHKNMYFSYTFSFWSNLLKPVSDEINCYSSAHCNQFITFMLLKIQVQLRSFGTLRCKYTCCTLIINVKYECNLSSYLIEDIA